VHEKARPRSLCLARIFVGEWSPEVEDVAAVPFEPPLSFPMGLASPCPSTEAVEELVNTALQLRDTGGWLTRSTATTDLPDD
jgi:hypothetical protein